MTSPRRPHRRRRPQTRLERLHGRHVIAAALTARRRPLHRLLVQKGAQRGDVDQLVELARSLGLPVVTADPDEWAEWAPPGEAGLQGAVLEAGPVPELRDVTELLPRRADASAVRHVVALDGVEDPRNLGAIARVADAAGACGLLLTDRRSAPVGPVSSRASAGALEWLPVCRVPNLARALERLKAEGLWVVAADPEAEVTLFGLPDRLLAGDLVVVLGAEGHGLRPSIQQQIDHPVRIPMRGHVESLNVASAAAIVLFEILRRAAAGRNSAEEAAGGPDRGRAGRDPGA